MKTKDKGYSLNVLIITLAVMLILTSTAIVSMRSLTKDKAISEFMSDIQDVEEFVFAYYSSKNLLPIVYDDGEARPVEVPGSLQSQAGPNDKGNYFLIDIPKLGKLKLFDSDRGGYLLNENSLKVFVMKPVEYEGIKYYTITDEILGLDKVYGAKADFEVNVIGNPVVWEKDFTMTVSIPDVANVDGDWTFKYYENGPITAKQFASMGRFFEYGDSIKIDKNGTHSIYVENASGESRVVNVVVNKIDDISPEIYRTSSNDIVALDNETGISKIHYKIEAYDTVPANVRFENIPVYMQGPKGALPTDTGGGTLSFLEAYTGERVNGIDPADVSIGKSISTYKDEYQEYLNRFAAVLADPSGDVKSLDSEFPQFQYNGVPYDDNELNIVLYVEDFAGNASVTNREGVLCKVSRQMLMDSHFVDTVIKPLTGVGVTINDGARYTTSRKVDLDIRAQGASGMSMFITFDEDEVPGTWKPLEREIEDFELVGDEGEIEVFVFVTANQSEGGTLKYERVSSKIFFDETPPSIDKPEVQEIGNDLKLYVKSMQVDNESGIDSVIFYYRVKGVGDFIECSSIDGLVVEENTEYEIKTVATDMAGNSSESEVRVVKSPNYQARTVPNAPAMATGMTAIVWDGTLAIPTEELEINHNTWKTADGEKVTWYNYELRSTVSDKRENIWANAKTSDGSYWVWIPRYAYKITYFEDSAKTKIKGFFQNSKDYGMSYFESDGKTVATDPESVKSEDLIIDILFLDGTSSTHYREEILETEAVVTKALPEEYIVHPAFTSTSSSTVSNALGRWSAELSGIWVAKFEASRQDASIDSEGTMLSIKSVPSVRSFTNVSIKNAYTYASAMNPALYSHLMKNSEWGAVSYLAYSAYGRNGYEPNGNRNEAHITGGGGSGSSSYISTGSEFERSFAYDVRDMLKSSGMYASTTGNIYGVYDLVGGAAEYVATYVANGNDAIVDNGEQLMQVSDPAMREVYTAGDPEGPRNNYNRNGVSDRIYGNAVYETSTGYAGEFGVNDDTTNFPSGANPFFTRGGSAEEGNSAGLFNFDESNGAASEDVGFRPVLAFR